MTIMHGTKIVRDMNITACGNGTCDLWLPYRVRPRITRSGGGGETFAVRTEQATANG
jgi:hypothetical protein